jgi:hypothetical protein
LHDREFCTGEIIAAVRARMNKQDLEKAEELKIRLLENENDSKIRRCALLFSRRFWFRDAARMKIFMSQRNFTKSV